MDNNILKQVSLDYIILELRVKLNKNLYEEKLISYEVFSKIQNLLMRKKNKIMSNNLGVL